MISRRTALGGMACLACAGLFGIAPARANNPVARTSLTPDQAIERLLEGNSRFVADDPSPIDAGRGRRERLTAGQAPFATIICCADSRAPPETLVHAGLGEVFVARVAGNTIPPVDLATVAYGVEALGTPAVMVLGPRRLRRGHRGGGRRDARHPGARHHAADARTDHLRGERGAQPARRPAGQRGAGECADRRALAHPQPGLRGQDQAGTLKVVAARYDLHEGKIEVLAL